MSKQQGARRRIRGLSDEDPRGGRKLHERYAVSLQDPSDRQVQTVSRRIRLL